MRRSLHFFWPRAESNLYAETKRLVDTGLAEAREGVERRPQAGPSTRSPTEDERRCESGSRHHRPLRGSSPRPSCDCSTRTTALRTTCSRRSSRSKTTRKATIDHYAQLLTEYARGDGLFPDRIHVNALLGSLSIEQARATVRWAQRSRAAVQAWETTETPDIEWAVKTMLHAARDPHDD